MRKLHISLTVGVLAIALSGAWAQDNSTPPSASEVPPGAPQQPAPAYGQDSLPAPVSENPPLSGLDLPSLEPNAAPLSYLQPGATFSESALTNAGETLGGGGVTSITLGVGSLTLKRLWSHYDLALNYLGGIEYYSLKGRGFQALQQFDVDQKLTWKRGVLSVRDSFSYLPEGNFGGSYGSVGSQGIASLGNTSFGGFWGGSSLGNLGFVPRIINVSLVDVSQNLSPKTTVTAAAGYALMHFYGSDQLGTSFIGSSQVSVQLGYNRALSPQSQLALVYGYQGFDFSVEGSSFHTHVFQALYGHRISGRMDLLLGAGPQFSVLDTQTATCSNPVVQPYYCQVFGYTLIPTMVRSTKPGVAARARFRYRFQKATMDLEFQRFETSGSGLFAGAQSNIASFSVEHPLSRTLNAFVDVGYSSNSTLQPLSLQQLTACGSAQTAQSVCPANDANAYNYAFVGGGLQRAFGRNFRGYASFQFNELELDHTYCTTAAPCNRISNRSVLTFGVDWTPRPIRID